jgi:hypothetical protein
MKTEYAGIDYSLGRSNVDRSNGIHFGVISLHAINMDRLEEFESQYGNPHCPKCGNECEAIPCHTEQTEHGVACYRDVPEEFENSCLMRMRHFLILLLNRRMNGMDMRYR